MSLLQTKASLSRSGRKMPARARLHSRPRETVPEGTSPKDSALLARTPHASKGREGGRAVECGEADGRKGLVAKEGWAHRRDIADAASDRAFQVVLRSRALTFNSAWSLL